jgi:hypothetical protein
LLEAPAARALSDCSTTACPSICQCGELMCDCLAGSSGAGLQSLADACARGDQACFTECALESPSTNALTVLQRLSVEGPLLVEPAARALPVCSATACPSINLDFSGQGSIFGSGGVGVDEAAVGGGCGERVAGARDTLCLRRAHRRRRSAWGGERASSPEVVVRLPSLDGSRLVPSARCVHFDEPATVCEFVVE